MASGEADLQRVIQAAEGIMPDDSVFDARMAAWFAAVAISDYISTTEAGSRLRLSMYGEPYASSVNHDPALVAGVRTAYQNAVDGGLKVVRRDRPNLEGVLRNNPYMDNPETWAAYTNHFYQMLEAWGLRSVRERGARYYLAQVPDQMDVVTFQAPDGTRTWLNADGYIGEGLDAEADPERQYSQRGANVDRPRSPRAVEHITKQLHHLSVHIARYAFDAADLLGYRPSLQTDAGIESAWRGWEAAEIK